MPHLQSGVWSIVLRLMQAINEYPVPVFHRFRFAPLRFPTPSISSYLELITAFKTSLATKRHEISQAKKRYEVGLEKLAFATESVNAMQVHFTRVSEKSIVSQIVVPAERFRRIPQGLSLKSGNK